MKLSQKQSHRLTQTLTLHCAKRGDSCVTELELHGNDLLLTLDFSALDGSEPFAARVHPDGSQEVLQGEDVTVVEMLRDLVASAISEGVIERPDDAIDQTLAGIPDGHIQTV